MPGSFLTRYLAGDSLEVWADLFALGPAVRAPEYAEDAQAVARTTMQRVRHWS